MKIECDKCGAKYSIADEKVRGKTFKIRCKKCSNVIIVRDSQAEAPEPEPEESAAVGWHLAIEGETVGPLSEEDVRQRYDAGEIDKETAIWQEGFEDWISLGEADVFADLPDREPSAPGEEEDPFAHAHDEDYSAGMGGSELGAGAALGAALSESAAEAPAEEPRLPKDDPRVSSLTGQRNENSVLFSLDNLQAMATAGGGAAAAATPSKSLATAAPASEGSGLIDIRSMGSTLGSGGGGGGGLRGGGGGAVDEALPSFGGGGGFGGLAATPLVAQPTAGEAPGGKRSGTLLYAMIGVVALLLGAVGFLAYIVLTKEPEVKVVKEQAPAPVMKDAKDEKKDGAGDKKEDEEDEGEDKGDTGAGTGGAQEGVAGSGSSGTKKTSGKSRKSGRKSSSSGGGSSGGTPEPSSSSSGGSGGGSSGGGSSGGSEMDVDCILNPDLPKCKKSKKKSSSSSSGGGGGGANLPEKLTITQVKAGMAKVKPAAKSCGLRHGAKGGEKVKVKVSISGSSGRVVSASPEGPHAGKPLGNCVAAAAKKATFPKFKKAQMGVVYPFTM